MKVQIPCDRPIGIAAKGHICCFLGKFRDLSRCFAFCDQSIPFRKKSNVLGKIVCLILQRLSLLSLALGLLSIPLRAQSETKVWLVVLGVAQDAGFPQIQCQKACCAAAWQNPALARGVVCLGLVDPQSQQSWLFEATPFIPRQWQQLQQVAPLCALSGVLLTHGHMGHYSGLLYFGREAMGADRMPVYAMPRMQQFLRSNGPWDQLLRLENIALQPLAADSFQALSPRLRVQPILVPHRDEYTETVGYIIEGPRRKALFIPDIDKWEKWERDIRGYIRTVDLAFLDATFFSAGELPGRNMAEIPHPFVEESLSHFAKLSPEDKAKVHFIHFNHSNPLLDPESEARQQVLQAGFRVAEEGMRFGL